MTRGNPCVEAVLEKNIPYVSGPQWLHDFVLRDRWVLAVAGTHGKTTTAGMATGFWKPAVINPDLSLAACRATSRCLLA